MRSAGAILPDGLRLGIGVGIDERPVGHLEFTEGNLKATAVMTAAQHRALAALLLRQADQLERADRPLLCIAGGG